MSSLSKAWETKVLKCIKGTESLTTPTLYIGLTTTVPTRTTPGTAAAYTGYARKALSAAKLKIVEGTETEAGYFTNEEEIKFPECTGSESKCKGAELFTALTGGESIAWTEITEAVIVTGITPFIPVEALKFTCS